MAETTVQPDLSTAFEVISLLPTQRVDFSSRVGEWLSADSIVAAKTSTSIDQQEADETAKLPRFHEIGVGFCGHIVDSRDHPGVVFKRAKPDYYDDLRKDADFHRRICAAIEDTMSGLLRVPRFHSFIEADDNWWSLQGHEFLATQNSRPPILCSERILPLPKHARESLINLFSLENQHVQHKNNAQNRDCLLRIYLGKRLPANTPIQDFKLRNFELTLEKLELLNIKKEPLANAIAQGLAMMHWHAKCDARDVEFVIGTSRPLAKEEATSTPIERRSIHVWLLDFNQCRDMTMDEQGIEKATSAFWDNDPYYPRSNHTEMDKDIWNYFKNSYLEASNAILIDKGGDTSLPGRFIEAITKRGLGKQDQANAGPPKGPRAVEQEEKSVGRNPRGGRRQYPEI